jgi:putative flippase GtrA
MKQYSRQGLWFCLIGVAAATTHFLSLILLVHYFKLMPQLANPIAFLIAFIISFLGHFHFTFRYSSRKWQQALWRWFISSISAFLLNQILFILSLKWLGDQAYWWLWFMVTILVTIITFILGKFWAFDVKDRRETRYDQC